MTVHFPATDDLPGWSARVHDGAGMRILLAEDDPRIAQFVAKGLREQAYAVDLAATGDQALYQADINSYDLVILDVMIPGRDGFEVCHRLRKSGKRMPILMLTARDAVEDRITGLDQGADDYLTKPFEFRELLARLRALLRRSGELRPPQIVIEDLKLDTAAQTAMRGEKKISLTTKEYALLEYLARNAGRVVGRAEIAEHVWDESFDPFSNLIEVYVNRLRGKIDSGSRRSLLHTRRGAGYMLGAEGEAPQTRPVAGSRKSHA
jgi:DNA-binding response OmpR family regulator